LLLVGVLVEGGLAALALLLGWLSGSWPLDRLRWSVGDALVGVAVGLPMVAGFFLCVYWPVGPLKRIKELSDEVIVPLFAPCPWTDLALFSLLAGVGEELLFRGYLQEAVARRWGDGTGIVVAAVLFGLLHPITPTYAVLAGLMGAYLGAVLVAHGNLLVPVVAHGGYDFVALVFLVRYRARPRTAEAANG
jgi:membrane protease YdiL (CAAX protease family)